jgi:tRNA threonylcarbamoyladenosine biosynthesis protein TsaB
LTARDSQLIWIVHRAYNLAIKRNVSNDIFLNGAAGEEELRARRTGEDERARLAARARGGLLTLGVETATEKRSAAVARGVELLAERLCELREGGTAAGVLEEIDRALADARVRLEEVELFAVAKGPGSFTGLRSGLATLKALAVTLGRPLVGVPTLHALAHAARPAERLVALIPAGRGEVFAQLLGVEEAGVVRELSGPSHVAPARLLESLKGLGGGVKWAGGGAFKYAELIREAAEASGLKFVEAADFAASPARDEWLLARTHAGLAADVASLGQSKYLGGGAGVADEVRALYVRPSDAEIKG